MPTSMLKKISWLGHDGFQIEADKRIYFDPYQLSGAHPPADLIFITHEHYDHCSPEDIASIQQDHTVIVTEKDSAKKLKGEVRVMEPGMSLSVEGIAVEAVPAYNTNKQFHPKQNGWLGFVITVQGTRIYHAGDTDHIPEMKDIQTDIALLPVSGTYVMTAEEAVAAAVAINPRVAIPMHYGAIVGAESDALKFKRGLEGKIAVHIL